MTIRIDQIRRQGNLWEFGIKGMKGQGVYGTLITGDDGRGLYIKHQRFDMPKPPYYEREDLIAPESFFIPNDSSPEQASRLVALALIKLGWGPEVDRHNRLIARSE